MPGPTPPSIDGKTLLANYGEPVTYRSQAGGAITLPALFGMEQIHTEKRQTGDYQYRANHASIDAGAVGMINAMDTLITADGTNWTIEEFSIDPSANVATLMLRSERLIDRHRRQNTTDSPPTGELGDGGTIGGSYQIGKIKDDEYNGEVGAGIIGQTYKIGKTE